VAATDTGALTTDAVSFFSIALPETQATFVVLTTSTNQTLTLTAEHHLPIGDACCAHLKKAKDVAIGERIYTASAGDTSARVAVVASKVVSTASGLHSPVLVNGGFPVVDGVVTSFDTLERVTLAKYGLAPLLTACKATGTCSAVRRTMLSYAHGDRQYIA